MVHKSRLLKTGILFGFCMVSLAGYAVAARRSMPADGAPYPSTNYQCFNYLNGQVLQLCGGTNTFYNWDLTAHVDNTASALKSMTIGTNGNDIKGTECWGVSTMADGSSSLGAPKTGQITGYPDPATNMTTNSVNVTSTGYFSVTCKMPWKISAGRGARIASYSYNQ